MHHNTQVTFSTSLLIRNDFFRITIYFDPEIGCWVKTPESHQCPIFVTRSASITCCYQNLSTVQYDQKYNHLFWSRDWRKTPVSILLSFLSSSCPRLQLLATSYQQQLPYQKQHFLKHSYSGISDSYITVGAVDMTPFRSNSIAKSDILKWIFCKCTTLQYFWPYCGPT